ncbi:hypothetical protein OEA41_010789 [Lepraria neglecta]|uniref:Ankyrin n=1 Tax=Lepraria neglecta TaxID=209136 RepID=A0AAD9Z0E7_9LECA|nr:hypothetical protein OEA41_010789 [Lepraria neglecta]
MEAQTKATLGDELHQACEDGDLDTIVKHVSRQRAANPSYKPPFPEMMYTAAGKDNLNVVKYCLEKGAAVTDNVMQKVLICRAKNTYIYFLESQAVEVDQYIPWFGDILSNVATDDDFEWAKLCLSHGANPNKNLYEEHKTILAAVAELASVEMAALLVENGAHVRGSGAIVMAAEEGKLKMVKFLLEKGADIDEIGIEHPTDERYGEDMGSALHRAVNGGHRDVVKFLIERGADVGLKDVIRRTPMDLAKARNDEELEKVLEEAGAVTA